MKKEIRSGQSKLLFEQGEYADDVAVLFLPGMSGGALGERFRGVADMVVELGHTSVRMSAWEGEDEVNTKTLRYLYTEIESATNYLVENGFEEIMMIGKSFGGALVLAYKHPHVTKKIMWAPAIGIAEEQNLSLFLDTPLKKISHLLDIHMSFEDVRTDDARLCIIHGTDDSVVPLENSQKIIEASENGLLEIIEGADHSFKTPEQESELLLRTKRFLREVR